MVGCGCVLTLSRCSESSSPDQRPGGSSHAGWPGYWLAGADGGVFSFNAPFFGSGNAGACGFSPQPPSTLNSALGCSDIAADPAGAGYWLLNAFRLATPFGGDQLSPSCTSLNGAIGRWTGMAVACRTATDSGWSALTEA